MAYISDRDNLFCSQLDDAIELCLTRQKPYFFSFMSERRQAVAEKYLKSVCFENFMFFGGYEASERKVLGLFYDSVEQDAFPICAIVFRFRKCDKLSHRDFLGALMSLGIERETVGDILVEDGRCVVFVKSELKQYITSQISKIGNVGVTVEEFTASELPKGRGQEELSFIVSSLRLDNIVAAITGLSREKTKNLILSGNVSADFVRTQNISQILRENTTLTIKGKGKFVINGIPGKTRKGRIKISVIHYR
ncbi:MAG: RNA-binding protein [Eubacterium sp.]